MGNWNMNIQGVGCHHNGDKLPEDANRMLARFVKELKAAGHSIESATFTHGAKDDMLNIPDWNPNYPAIDLKTGVCMDEESTPND